MRGHATALGRAGAAVAGPSSGAARSSLLHHARHIQSRNLATHADPATAALAPTAFFQDLVNEAMKPTFLHSALLSPSPRSIQTANDKVAKRTSRSISKTSVSSLAEANNQPTQATGSKIYANRTQMIIRLIRLNRILSAMAAFEDDVANPNRTPFTVQELEHFVVALRIQSKKHPTTRPSPRHSPAFAGDLWRPSKLDPSIPAKSLSIPTQCTYAMAAIYDVCIESKAIPTSKMISSMLASLTGVVTPGQLNQAADTALGHLVPSMDADPAARLRHVSHRALSTFITTYGSAQKPEKGEALLDRWTKAQNVNGASEHKSVLHADESIDLTGWGHNVVLWQSLIKARVDAGHLHGARKWLDLYRAASRSSRKTTTGAANLYPPIKPEPYLAYMAGIRRKAERPRPGRHWISRVTAELRGAVGLMMDDSVAIESSVLAFVIGFEVRVGNVDGSASLIQELSSVIEDRALQDVQLLRALLRFRKAAADVQRGASPASGFTIEHNLNALPSLRSLIRSLVLVGDGRARTSQDNLASARSRSTLNAALDAAMAARDYPAAIVVLNLFERWRIVPSLGTYTSVVAALAAHGHFSAMSAEPGEVAVCDSKLNLAETIQSLVREASNAQEQTVFQMAANPSVGETSLTSARPSTRLRQTQYLVRVLNRACDAEFDAESGPETPAWLTLQRKAETREHGQISLPNRVKSAIFAAQDELLGKKEERNDWIKRNKVLPKTKVRLFRVAQSLSPHRRGMDAPAKPELPTVAKMSGTAKRVRDSGRTQDHIKIPAARSAAAAARPYSTSAGMSASCDLASGSKGDYTHLEPVRTIYIPGFVPYELGLALQEHLVRQRSDARAALRALSNASSTSASSLAGLSTISRSATETQLRAQAEQDTLLLLQHRPVYTEGRRHDSENSLVSNHLRSLGADYHLTKRGGQITYHGPGQLVGYPILNLASMSLASRCYVDRIQDSLISLLAARGVETVPPPDEHTGVWADEYHKIASIGIQVRHRISSHGFALNVEQRAMQGFKHIVACGIVGRSMTCLQDRLDPEGAFARHYPKSDADPKENTESIAHAYKAHFATTFRRRIRNTSAHEMSFELLPEHHRQTLAEKLGIDVASTERVVGAVTVDACRLAI